MTSPTLCKKGPQIHPNSRYTRLGMISTAAYTHLTREYNCKASCVHCSCCRRKSADCVHEVFSQPLYCVHAMLLQLQQLPPHIDQVSVQRELPFWRCALGGCGLRSATSQLGKAKNCSTMFCLVQQQRSWKKKAAMAATAHCLEMWMPNACRPSWISWTSHWISSFSLL